MTHPRLELYQGQAQALLAQLSGYNYRQARYKEDTEFLVGILLEWDHQVVSLEQRLRVARAHIEVLRQARMSYWAWLRAPFRTFARYFAFLIDWRKTPVL